MELYRWLKLEWPTQEAQADGVAFPPGSCHFPQYGEEYFKQLTAERRVIRIHKGFPKATWEKDPSRNNEALDCRVYARAAAVSDIFFLLINTDHPILRFCVV
jgi:phage terminase large subunit GpA-like protein